MSDRVHLVPKFGRRVRHADGRLFDAGGEPVVLTAFYRRLIADGDLVPAPTLTSRRPKMGPKKGTPA